MDFFVIGLLVLLLFLSVLVFARNAKLQQQLPPGTKEIPSTSVIPVVGSFWEFFRAGDNMLPVLEKYLYSLGKIFRFTIMGNDFVLINEPDYLKHILVTKFGEGLNGIAHETPGYC